MADKASRILVVEDNDAVRAIFVAVLADAGYTVIEAADGATALVLAESAEPDLAVLDLHLPDRSGLEIASLFQQRLPFLVLTRDAESAQVKKCTDLGALGYLVKPIDVDGFLRQVRIALQRGWETLNLRRALQETQTISKALGILMAHHRLSDELAYRKLLSFATARRRPVAEVAKALVGAFRRLPAAADPAARTPRPTVPADLRELLDGPDA